MVKVEKSPDRPFVLPGLMPLYGVSLVLQRAVSLRPGCEARIYFSQPGRSTPFGRPDNFLKILT
jgi:hypothetical protein